MLAFYVYLLSKTKLYTMVNAYITKFVQVVYVFTKH